MNRVAVYSAFPITPRMVADFVIEQGGVWLNRTGSLERAGGAVFLDDDPAFYGQIFDPQDLDQLRNLLGAAPQSHIELCSPRDDASRALATEIARLLVQRYGGVLQQEHESFGSTPAHS